MKTDLSWGLSSAWAILVIGLAGLAGAGCASANVNPPHPAAKTGYVDFISHDDDLCWQVSRIGSTGKTNEIFSDFDPLQEHILRLAFAPGHYQFNVNFLNRVIMGSDSADVEIKDGFITPVYVSLVDAGTTQVESSRTQLGGTGTYYGRYGRHTIISSDQTAMYRVVLEPQTAVAYQTKTNMPYADGK